MRHLFRGVLLVLAAATLAAGPHASPRGSISAQAWPAGLASAKIAGVAKSTNASALLDRPGPSGATLHQPSGGRSDRTIAAASLAQRDEPTLPPPARIDSDALERAGPPRPAGSARAPRTLRVCPAGNAQPDCRHDSLQAALAAALPGDRVVLAPGVYEEGAVITTPNLVVQGEPGAHLRGHTVEGKAALVVKANDVLIEGIECSGIAVRDRNGACVRNEGRDLTIRNVHFHDNQQGILGGSPSSGTLRVEESLFERNGFGGRAHGVYINPEIETFIFRRNRILATTGAGHGFKSRAQRTIIENNVIASLDGHDSRAIDIPNGGKVVIRGNVLEKGPNSENGQMIGLALEGQLHDVNETLIENNLFVFDTVPEGLLQDLARAVGLLAPKGVAIVSKSPGEVILRDNMIVGAREIGDGVSEQGNRIFSDRREADLPPYPALPETSG